MSTEPAAVNRPSNVGDEPTEEPLSGQHEGPSSTSDEHHRVDADSSTVPRLSRRWDVMADQWWNRTRYQLYAPVYDWLAKPWEAGRRRAIERLDPEPGDRILILGCGTGSDLHHLPSDAEIVAIDLSPAMIRRTAQRAEQLDLDVDARVGDAQSLPFENDSFDAVILHLVLSVVPDPRAVVDETARVLDPDGRVSIYDKFVPVDETPSLPRRVANPVAKLLFADLNRSLEPMLSATGLQSEEREFFLGIYSVTIARKTHGD